MADENADVLDEAVDNPVETVDEAEDEILDEVPVHGVIAPEGVDSGDGRRIAEGGLTMRDLPIPLRYEYASTHGGDTSEVATVGRVDEVWRDGNLVRFRGAVVMDTRFGEEVIAGLASGILRGVSLDGDAIDVEPFQNEDGGDVALFTRIRAAGLTIVDIPAFQEAYIQLGADDPTPEELEEMDAVLAAAGCGCDEASQEADFATTAPPRTQDGPGWITDRQPTSRLREYWVHGAGAAKIRWGTPGAFNRCRRQLAKYVQRPDWLAGTCANMYYHATGRWPGRQRGDKGLSLQASGELFTLVDVGHDMDVESELARESLLASAAQVPYPAEWFSNPNLPGPTPLQVDTETGRVWGHIAAWGVCHIGIPGTCTQAPRSRSNYSLFKSGVVPTTQGDMRVGKLTSGVGHPSPRLRASRATAHYDKPQAVRAYVNVGEDAHGIWFSGVLAPGLTEEQVSEFRSVGSLSGDWREVNGSLELIAAVSVNTPGFPIPAFSIDGGEQTSLVAAGFVIPAQGDHEDRLARFKAAKAKFNRTRLGELRARLHEGD